MRRLARWVWPYAFHLLAMGGCVTALIDVLTGHPLSRGNQVFWLVIVAVWIGISAVETWTQKMTAESRDSWKSMYEQVSARRWN